MATFQPIDVNILNRGLMEMKSKPNQTEKKTTITQDNTTITLSSITGKMSTEVTLKNNIIWLKLGSYHYKIWLENGFVNFQRYKNINEPTKAQVFQLMPEKMFIIGQKPSADNITSMGYQVFDPELPDQAITLKISKKGLDTFLQVELLAANLQVNLNCQQAFSDKGGCPFIIPTKKI